MCAPWRVRQNDLPTPPQPAPSNFRFFLFFFRLRGGRSAFWGGPAEGPAVVAHRGAAGGAGGHSRGVGGARLASGEAAWRGAEKGCGKPPRARPEDSMAPPDRACQHRRPASDPSRPARGRAEGGGGQGGRQTLGGVPLRQTPSPPPPAALRARAHSPPMWTGLARPGAPARTSSGVVGPSTGPPGVPRHMPEYALCV